MASLLEQLESEAAPPLRVVSSDTPAKSPMQTAWERWKPEVAKESEGSLFPVNEVEAALTSGRAIIWPGKNSAMILEVETYPSGDKVLRVWWGLGDLDELKAMRPGVEGYGRLQGCSMALVEGRKGWERALKSEGFEHYSTTLKKVL